MSFGNSEEWMVELEKAKPIVKRAVDLGMNFFDTANLYSNGRSEEIVGELLKGHRDDVVIATKVRLKVGEGPNKEGLSRHHILQQVRKSLKRLQTDRIDLYQIHRWDYGTTIEETLLTLNDLVRQGTVGYIGASSMRAGSLPRHCSQSTISVSGVSSRCRTTTTYAIERKNAR